MKIGNKKFGMLMIVFLFLSSIIFADPWLIDTSAGRKVPWWWDVDHKTHIKVLCCTKEADFQADVDAAIAKINGLGLSWQLEKTTDPLQAHVKIHARTLPCKSAGKTNLPPGLVHKDSKGNISGVEVWTGNVKIKQNKDWEPGERVDVMTHELMHCCRLGDSNDPNDKMYHHQRDEADWCKFSAHDIQELKDTDASSSQTSVATMEPSSGEREVAIPHAITPPTKIELAAATNISIEPFHPANLNVMGVIWDSNHIYAVMQPTASAFHSEFFWIYVFYGPVMDRTYGVLLVNNSTSSGLLPHAVAVPSYLEMDYWERMNYIDATGSYHEDPAVGFIMDWQVESEDADWIMNVKPNPHNFFPITEEMLPGTYHITLWMCDDFDQCSSTTVIVKINPPATAKDDLWEKYQ